MRTEIVERQKQAMLSNDWAAIVSCSPEGFTYVTGFVSPSQQLIRHRHAMAIVKQDGVGSLLCVDMEATTFRTRVPDADLVVWREFHDDPMKVFADALRERGLARSRIGIELDYLPAADFARLSGYLPDAVFVNCVHVLSRMRQIKTPSEIEHLAKLARMADQAIGDSLAAVRCGDTEMDIAAVLTRRIYELGAENFKLMIVATGERSELPNVGPTPRVLQTRDVCRVEIFSVLDGYQAGVCRTAYVQEPPPKAEEIWRLLVECKYRILDLVKPGASCLDIYRDFSARLASMNLPPISFVGHGIGLHLHEDPYIGETPILGNPGVDARLEENMVLGFEPLCYRTGYGYGMQNKDMMVVTGSGCRLISDVTNTDSLIRID